MIQSQWNETQFDVQYNVGSQIQWGQIFIWVCEHLNLFSSRGEC